MRVRTQCNGSIAPNIWPSCLLLRKTGTEFTLYSYMFNSLLEGQFECVETFFKLAYHSVFAT